MAGYCALAVEVGYLEQVKIAPPELLLEAERLAADTVDGVLGKRWSTDLDDDAAGTPRMIMAIAEILAAAYVLRKKSVGNLDRLEHARDLEKMGRDDLREIKTGHKAIKLRDGSWDPIYCGTRNAEEGKAGGGLRVIC